jgi:hypothetical protein
VQTLKTGFNQTLGNLGTVSGLLGRQECGRTPMAVQLLSLPINQTNKAKQPLSIVTATFQQSCIPATVSTVPPQGPEVQPGAKIKFD